MSANSCQPIPGSSNTPAPEPSPTSLPSPLLPPQLLREPTPHESPSVPHAVHPEAGHSPQPARAPTPAAASLTEPTVDGPPGPTPSIHSDPLPTTGIEDALRSTQAFFEFAPPPPGGLCRPERLGGGWVGASDPFPRGASVLLGPEEGRRGEGEGRGLLNPD